jgi:hypothetical protein
VREPFVEPEDVVNLRARVERKLRPILARYHALMAEAVAAGQPVEPLLEELAAELRAVLTVELTHIITQQAAASVVSFDAAVVNAEAIAWAQRYTFDLVRGITDTTRTVLQRATSAFFDTPGMTRAELEALIEPAFGPVRARMIATTEVTRAYSEATNEDQRWLAEAGIQMRRVWLTLNDELVCPICGPLHDQPEEVWRAQFPGGPPAHVNCRCSTELEVV